MNKKKRNKGKLHNSSEGKVCANPVENSNNSAKNSAKNNKRKPSSKIKQTGGNKSEKGNKSKAKGN